LIIITGSPETQTELLHKHLAKYPRHSNRDWQQRSVTGSVWDADWRRRQNKLKKALYAQGNECSDEQRMAYELLFGREGYKSQNVCLVGVPASGNTWIAKKLSKLLE
jgi:tRNA uridine 5-carbamoylmethylation protein Kti12